MVETLNGVFGPMPRIAEARRGELLKFVGDALLFLFREDGHAEQACDAAVEMRRALRAAAAPRPTTTGTHTQAAMAPGRLPLSMSVGIHSGDIHLFLVGSPTIRASSSNNARPRPSTATGVPSEPRSRQLGDES